MKIKQMSLQILIISIIASALLSVIMFLSGSFGNDITWKIIGTTLMIFVASFAGLPLGKRYDEKKSWESLAGIVIVGVAVIMDLIFLWDGFMSLSDTAWFAKSLLMINAWAICFTVLCFLLNVMQEAKKYGILAGKVTIILTLLGCLYLSYLILNEFTGSDFMLRLMVSDLILVVTGMVLSPILKRFEQ